MFSISVSYYPSSLFLSSQYFLLLSSQCSDTGIQFSIKMVHFNITFMPTSLIKFLDSSVTRWNDTTCCKNKCSFIDCN
ncbi:MAG: hypothetical protein LBU02_03020 [Rickettsiales bacterium]|nr:hypothetical protein [Rickettsiales bacterium]